MNGSVGLLGISGTLAGHVGGLAHIVNPSKALINGTTFVGNPPGYIFFDKLEIWPKGASYRNRKQHQNSK